MLVDTDVFIWYLRGNEKAYRAIVSESGLCISVITYMELVQGMRNKTELNYLRRSLRQWNAKLLYISEEISARAMFYVEQYYLSHSLQVADALIGATAVAHSLSIFTGNDRHYRIVKDIQVKKFRP